MRTPSSSSLSVAAALCLAAALGAVRAETSVELLAPLDGKEGPQFGLIFVPGATLGGETYGPLSEAIQVPLQRNYSVAMSVGCILGCRGCVHRLCQLAVSDTSSAMPPWHGVGTYNKITLFHRP